VLKRCGKEKGHGVALTLGVMTMLAGVAVLGARGSLAEGREPPQVISVKMPGQRSTHRAYRRRAQSAEVVLKSDHPQDLNDILGLTVARHRVWGKVPDTWKAVQRTQPKRQRDGSYIAYYEVLPVKG